MIRVKICGVCSPEDATAASAAGADFIGVILSPGHRRSQTHEHAAAIYAAATTRRVGVFVDPAEPEVIDLIRQLQLDVVQFHGQESPALTRRVCAHAAVWKSIRVRDPRDLLALSTPYHDHVDALLLDGFDPASAGGSGHAFDWRAAAAARRQLPDALTIVVAGGLNPDNVAAAIAALQPDIVDVSSGVERALCEKSTDKMHDFVAAARRAAAQAVPGK